MAGSPKQHFSAFAPDPKEADKWRRAINEDMRNAELLERSRHDGFMEAVQTTQELMGEPPANAMSIIKKRMAFEATPEDQTGLIAAPTDTARGERRRAAMEKREEAMALGNDPEFWQALKKLQGDSARDRNNPHAEYLRHQVLEGPRRIHPDALKAERKIVRDLTREKRAHAAQQKTTPPSR